MQKPTPYDYKIFRSVLIVAAIVLVLFCWFGRTVGQQAQQYAQSKTTK